MSNIEQSVLRFVFFGVCYSFCVLVFIHCVHVAAYGHAHAFVNVSKELVIFFRKSLNSKANCVKCV